VIRSSVLVDWSKRDAVREGRVTIPFGFVLPNGMNFAESIHNPNSVLRRLLAVVDGSVQSLTKREILAKMGYQLDIVKTHYRREHYSFGWVNGAFVSNEWGKRIPYTLTHHKSRGYLSDYFRACVKAGFLTHRRRADRREENCVTWEKGPNFPNIKNLVNVC
jgi:hypothetical protein